MLYQIIKISKFFMVRYSYTVSINVAVAPITINVITLRLKLIPPIDYHHHIVFTIVFAHGRPFQ